MWGAIIGGLMIGGGLVSQTIGHFSGDDFNAYLAIIGAIGLILTAILNPEGIATGTALTVKALWAKARGRRAGRGAPRDGALRTDVGGRGVTVTLLQTTDLTVTFGGLHANNEVNITVAPQTFVGLIGPNGAGKTTFIDAITGYVSSTGAITLDGEDLRP